MAEAQGTPGIPTQPMIQPDLLGALQWRCIGPFRGGRVVAVAGDPVNPMTFYFGACAGGVWKTTDGGTYWQNVSDGFFKTAAVGAMAGGGFRPQVLFFGLGGEGLPRRLSPRAGGLQASRRGEERDAPGRAG